MKTAICVRPLAALKSDEPYPISDEICMGWAGRILKEKDDSYLIETHYGYKGHVDKDAVRITSLSGREDLQYINRHLCDVMSQPDVESEILLTLPLGSFVTIDYPVEDNGYLRIKAADDTVGFVPAIALSPRLDSDDCLLSDDPDRFLKQTLKEDEETIRERIVSNCRMFTGLQYRWGGKSGTGIDCSGLAFMAYMLAGVLIWRDADIMPGYPIKKIPVSSLKKGDLIFFPGHVAVYLGEGKYIHSTAAWKAFGVTFNSLNPDDPDYRRDLAEDITECGSLF